MAVTVDWATALVISNSARGLPSPWRCVMEFLSQQVHGAAGCDDGVHGRQISSMLICLCPIGPTSAPHTDYCICRDSGAGTACTAPSRVLRATARGDWHSSWMASTPSSVSNKNNECGIINVHIFNITHFQNNFYLPQSTPTGNERCQHFC